MLIETNGMNHVAISVPSIEETVTWYSEIFGFTVVKYSEIPTTGIKVCHMQCNGFQLEIFQHPQAAPLPENRLYPHTDFAVHGQKHFCMGVKDGKLTKEKLENAGIEIVLIGTVDDTYAIFIRDNSGILVELYEEK